MKRREFITLLGGAAAAWPLAARAQQSKVPVVGYLSSFTQTQSVQAIAAVRRGLSENGLVEGKDFAIEFRISDGQYDRLPGLAAELVSRPVALILGAGPPAAIAAKAQTTTIPIVFVVGYDPVAAGLVTSLSRPGGNVTGMTHMSDTLVEKRLGILLQLVPRAAVIAMLANPVSPDVVPEIKAMQAVTQQRGLQLQLLNAATPGELDVAFTALAEKRPDALVVASDPFYLTRASELVALAAKLALPTMYPFLEFSGPGGLVSYGTNRLNTYRLAGGGASRILKGAKPADLPVMQPTLFELVINLKTAKALGIEVPATLLAIADEVIE
jgi:putative tryptophan/tyrosine transport system substrate-binding protein